MQRKPAERACVQSTRRSVERTGIFEVFGITGRAEVLRLVCDTAALRNGAGEGTMKKHLEHLFVKLAVESRNATSLRTIEIPSRPTPT